MIVFKLDARCMCESLLGDLVNAMSQILNILWGDTRHRDATVFGQVNAEVCRQTCTLFGVHAGEAEHTDLISDVLPVSGRAEIFLKNFEI